MNGFKENITTRDTVSMVDFLFAIPFSFFLIDGYKSDLKGICRISSWQIKQKRLDWSSIVS